MLKIRGLKRKGLEPVDLDIADGEAVAVSGPSGAGKTLLLRAIADLDPNEGRLALDGRNRAEMPAPAWRRRVMYLPAEAGWWADKVGEHYADPEAAAELLPELRLPREAMDWPVARLSTGERQRLALARALVLEPDILLLDEPTSGLDPDATRAVEEMLKRQLENGAGMLFVTHDKEQAARLARRRLRIVGGKVTEERI